MLNHFPFEFHVSRSARERYDFDLTMFATNGNVVFANFHAARVFAQKMNARRDLLTYPEQTVRAGDLNAMGLIDEILHLVIAEYRRLQNPKVIEMALAWLWNELGENEVERLLVQFTREFPPRPVHLRQQTPEVYLSGESNGFPNRQVALEELLMLWLANQNPAFSPFHELFDDSRLAAETRYTEAMDEFHRFFSTQPAFGPQNQNLIDLLLAPARAFPGSLTGQLEFLRTHWSGLIGTYLYRLLSSLDLIREETKAVFFGPGPAQVYEFAALEHEPERFSPDRDWMPNLVLLAKNSYVWLDQLSKRYRLPITRLDEIPEEELKRLGAFGFSGLWLIGLWERSRASQRIKQMRGNPEAVASAYSLLAYDIAQDLGGEEAYQKLRDKAWKYGIRLASDMVPNHMGIDSRWVIEHPDWFVSLDYPPFPAYTFNGPNLSWDNRVGIYLEDHYYDNSDAAVVFKRVDYWTGSEKFIYHGNDGTSMPWNDTAQLDYLKAEVREAVIQTILHVARKFPVIRFDAAMTLAKKHYQRLWFPEPGSGGDIPSRAEYGLTKSDFDQAMPEEFWREVVDRVAQEAPDTLLLAEAFWLMEGYFVRTLGMHRVYNSAFMNMMRDEKNQEYRLVIKNTLEFDPEILKRYVNFMNNPDERTAVDQFGKGDKYFGICIMMATLPGLPMFGHGQIEGFTEKYGMEYRQAYWDENEDQYLIERHQREVFPLLRKRYLFAEAHNFLLFDFYSPEGFINEDVFAYTNQSGSEHALVIYHNKFASARGWIRTSAAVSVKQKENEERVFVQRNLGEALDVHSEAGYFTIFHDHITGLEYLRRSQELHEKGLYVELDAYRYHVFLDFREVGDNESGQYSQLENFLNGRGVPSISDALKEIFLQSVHQPYRELVNAGQIDWVIQNRLVTAGSEDAELALSTDKAEQVLDEIATKIETLLLEVQAFIGGDEPIEALRDQIRAEMAALMSLPVLAERYPLPKSRKYTAALAYLMAGPAPSSTATDQTSPLQAGDAYLWGGLFGWIADRHLGRVQSESDPDELSRTWVDEWLLGKILAGALRELSLGNEAVQRAVRIVKLLVTQSTWCSTKLSPPQRARVTLKYWFSNPESQHFLVVNRYRDVLWFNQEAFDQLLWWSFTANIIDFIAMCETASTGKEGDTKLVTDKILACWDVLQTIKKAEAQSGYQVEKLLQLLD